MEHGIFLVKRSGEGGGNEYINEYIKQNEKFCNFRRKVGFLDDSRNHFQIFLFSDPSMLP